MTGGGQQVGIAARRADDGNTLVQPALQMRPFPAAQMLRGLIELFGGFADAVSLDARLGRRQPRLVGGGLRCSRCLRRFLLRSAGVSFLGSRLARARLGVQPERRGHRDPAKKDEEHQRQEAGHGRVAPAPAPAALERPDAASVDRPAGEEAGEVVSQVVGAGVALDRLLFQAAHGDGGEIARHLGPKPADGNRLVVHDREQRFQRRGGLERGPAGEALIEDRPQRVDVHRRADLPLLAGGLFGGHVAWRADHGAGLRRGIGRAFGQQLGEAEVGDLGAEVRGPWSMVRGQRQSLPSFPVFDHGRRTTDHGRQQNIARFQVAMHDTGIVSVLHGAGELLDQPGRVAGRLRCAGEELLEAATLDQLQRQIRQPLMLADIVNADDSRVRQPSHRGRLDAEPPQRVAAGMGPGQDHLQGDHPSQPQMPGLVDDPHAAAADLAQHLVARHFGESGGHRRADAAPLNQLDGFISPPAALFQASQRGVGHLGVGLRRTQRRRAAREEPLESSLAFRTALDVPCEGGVGGGSEAIVEKLL